MLGRILAKVNRDRIVHPAAAASTMLGRVGVFWSRGNRHCVALFGLSQLMEHVWGYLSCRRSRRRVRVCVCVC